MFNLYRSPDWHPQPRRRGVPPASGAVVLAGLDFDTSGYVFTQRTGLAIPAFALFPALPLTVSVYALADLALASQLFSYSASTDAAGKLARKTHASLVAASWYFFVARNADGTLNGCGPIQAT